MCNIYTQVLKYVESSLAQKQRPLSSLRRLSYCPHQTVGTEA